MMKTLILLGACMSARLLSAQTPDTSGASVSLSITPQAIPRNGTVTVSGLAYPHPGVRLSMTVTPPSGSPTTLDLTADASAHYSSTFTKTEAEGEYAVVVQAGAKGTPARPTFTVRSYIVGTDSGSCMDSKLSDCSALRPPQE